MNKEALMIAIKNTEDLYKVLRPISNEEVHSKLKVVTEILQDILNEIAPGEAYKDKRVYCKGCRNEIYNQGTLAKQCWYLPSAEIVLRKKVHINQRPPWNQEPITTLNCYWEEKYVFVKPDQVC